MCISIFLSCFFTQCRTATNHVSAAVAAALATSALLVLTLQQEKARRDEMCREKDRLQGEVAELGGLVKSQERLLELEKVNQQ